MRSDGQRRDGIGGQVRGRHVHGDLLGHVPVDVANDHRQERDDGDAEHEQDRPEDEAPGPHANGEFAARDVEDVPQVAHRADSSAAAQRPFFEIERADLLDEDLLERRVSDLEPEHVAAGLRGPEHGLRVGPGVHAQLGEVMAGSRHRDVRQGQEPVAVAVAGGRHADDLVTGRALDLPRRAGRDDTSVVDDRDGVAQLLGLVELVRAEQDRLAPIAHLGEGGLEHRDVHRVERGEGLVHQQDVGIVEDRRDVLDLLLVALRQAVRLAVREFGDPEAPEPGEGLLASACPRHPVQRREVDQLVDDRHARVETALLGHVAPHTSRPGLRLAILPGHGPRVGPEEAEDDPHRRRLAGPVRAQEPVDLARPDGQADAVEGLDLAERLLQAIDLQHRSPRKRERIFDRGCRARSSTEKSLPSRSWIAGGPARIPG